jgi:NADH-quinone oxidoreductase subunit L
VLAYSSISQLGFMLLGLASGSLYAGMFHLVTHAFFKALLFLCAGAYIHRYATNDMVAIGRSGGRSMRLTTAGLLVGGGALAGFPPLAGFYSKEGILAAVGSTGYGWLVVGAYLGSFLTAYYTFRMIFLVVRPEAESAAAPAGDYADAHGHGPVGWVMLGPIVGLTLLAAGSGFGGGWMAGLMGVPELHPSTRGMALAIGVVLAGMALAWFEFGRRGAAQLGWVSRVAPLHRLFARKWFIDEIYAAVLGRLMAGVSRACALVENRGIDRTVDGLAQGTIRSGRASTQIQNGRLQFYVATSVLFLAIACYLLSTL